jgi:hypothetical protein
MDPQAVSPSEGVHLFASAQTTLPWFSLQGLYSDANIGQIRAAEGLMPGKAKIGRPIKKARSGELAILSIRVPASLKEKLVTAAKKSGHSYGREAERRLEESFKAERSIFGDPETYGAMRMLAGVIGIVEAQFGKRWMHDLATYTSARRAIDRLLNDMQPKPPSELIEIVGILDQAYEDSLVAIEKFASSDRTPEAFADADAVLRAAKAKLLAAHAALLRIPQPIRDLLNKDG